jgi:hypothetical protein
MGDVDLKAHEKGHYYQSWLFGWTYLYFIGIPSGLHALVHYIVCNDPNYFHFGTETFADELADKYAKKKKGVP